MKCEKPQPRTRPSHLLLALCLTFALLAPAPPAAAEDEAPPQVDMAEMMARARQYTQPGEHHELLEKFLGEWENSLRITMAGAGAEPEKGSSRCEWLMEGRWLRCESQGTMMGMPTRTFMILGYDNFKMSYVTAMVNSLDTALLTAEGDLDPGGKALIAYGTLDEYLTGEHDKMVKYVWRFVSDDEMLLEVHDLPIGEKNTQVVEIRYRRKPAEPAGGQGS